MESGLKDKMELDRHLDATKASSLSVVLRIAFIILSL